MTSIREVDHSIIGDGTRGPVTSKLQKAYFDLVEGRSVRSENWLALIK